jgi:hypothetical protein
MFPINSATRFSLINFPKPRNQFWNSNLNSFFTSPLAIWPISPEPAHQAHAPLSPFLLPRTDLACRRPSTATMPCRPRPTSRAMEQTRRPSHSLTGSCPPPSPLLTRLHFLPLLHFGNGTIEGVLYRPCPPFPAASTSIWPYKRMPRSRLTSHHPPCLLSRTGAHHHRKPSATTTLLCRPAAWPPPELWWAAHQVPRVPLPLPFPWPLAYSPS